MVSQVLFTHLYLNLHLRFYLYKAVVPPCGHLLRVSTVTPTLHLDGIGNGPI